MSTSSCQSTLGQTSYRRNSRRGAVTVLAAFLMAAMMAALAFAIDIGYMYVVRAQAQNAADAAALAGASELMGAERLRGTLGSVGKIAEKYASFHRVASQHAGLVVNEDVQVGRLDDFVSQHQQLSFDETEQYNALTVTVRATAARNRQTAFFFAKALGYGDFDTVATATAAFSDRVSGFRTTERHPRTTLLPFTVHVTSWKSLISDEDVGDSEGVEDSWAHDPSSGTVTRGSDGIPELKLYPNRSGSGNWGTVDIGNRNNSTADLERQIREGVSNADLASHGGALELDEGTKTLFLNGDTGLSAGMKDALAEIIGEPRSIPLYRSASGNGNNMEYEIVGFAGIRIVAVRLTDNPKSVVIQPAYVLDRTSMHSAWATDSDYVVQPVRLVR